MIERDLNAYLKKQYPVIAEAATKGTVSGNEMWLLDIAIQAFRAGFACGWAGHFEQVTLEQEAARAKAG